MHVCVLASCTLFTVACSGTSSKGAFANPSMFRAPYEAPCTHSHRHQPQTARPLHTHTSEGHNELVNGVNEFMNGGHVSNPQTQMPKHSNSKYAMLYNAMLCYTDKEPP